MEHMGDAVCRANADCVRADDGTASSRYVGPLAESHEWADIWRKARGLHLGDSIVTFIKNRMVIEGRNGAALLDSMKRPAIFLSQHEATRDIQLGECGFSDVEEKGNMISGAIPNKFFVGPKFAAVGRDAQEFISGRLTFRLVDYGGELTLPSDMKQMLGKGDDIERNQCASLAFSA